MPEETFYHPFEKPYGIQIQFMQSMYEVLEQAQIGIFESPTGTGKSLSLICAAITWLRKFQLNNPHPNGNIETRSEEEEDDDDEPSWLKDQHEMSQKKEIQKRYEDWKNQIETSKEIFERRKLESKRLISWGPKKAKVNADNTLISDEAFEIDTFESSNVSNPVLDLLYQESSNKSKNSAIDNKPKFTRIFYTSRTNTQLDQFIDELRKVNIPEANWETSKLDKNISKFAYAKCVRLAGRNNLCINDSVLKLSSVNAMNEKCLALQRDKNKCRFLENDDRLDQLGSFILSGIKDIEDLTNAGEVMQYCPYYAARRSCDEAEIVVLPYQMILNGAAREALGIDIKDQILIIDEAHNLIDTIMDIYSCSITEANLRLANHQLTTYISKFQNRFRQDTKMCLDQMQRIIERLNSFLLQKKTSEFLGIVTSDEIMAHSSLDTINLAKLVKLLNEKKIARKIDGYAVKLEEKTNAVSTPVLLSIQSFLLNIANPSNEGRIFVQLSDQDPLQYEYNYMLLDAGPQFRSIAEEARSVILAGGTMSPMEQFSKYLLPNSVERIKCFSYHHVIPDRNIVCLTLPKGPREVDFNFTYKNKEDIKMMIEAGMTLLNICQIVPHGVVVFFPSYKSMSKIFEVWNSQNNIMEQVKRYKKVFVEPKNANEVENILSSYAQTISNDQGALLLCVVGARLSEGINFSDNLARCICVIGLPFPNIQTMYWKERLTYMSSRHGEAEAKHLIELTCMKAVNQAIGRAIRHINDYAAIILLDQRFCAERIQSLLPSWIQDRVCPSSNFVDSMNILKEFYTDKN